jgi:hypothetical protein
MEPTLQSILLRLFHVPMPVFIPFFLGIIVLLLGIKDLREDNENEKSVKFKRLYLEIGKACLLMLLAVFIWMVFY